MGAHSLYFGLNWWTNKIKKEIKLLNWFVVVILKALKTFHFFQLVKKKKKKKSKNELTFHIKHPLLQSC